MDRGSAFEVQLGGGIIALSGNFADQRIARRLKERLHARNFEAVFIVGAALETRREAHLHFRVDAAGELRIGMEVLNAAPHLEKVERVVGELLGGSAGRKWSVVEVLATKPAQARRDRRTRKFIFQMQFNQRREPQPQALRVFVRKRGAEKAVKEKSGFEI